MYLLIHTLNYYLPPIYCSTSILYSEPIIELFLLETQKCVLSFNFKQLLRVVGGNTRRYQIFIRCYKCLFVYIIEQRMWLAGFAMLI